MKRSPVACPNSAGIKASPTTSIGATCAKKEGRVVVVRGRMDGACSSREPGSSLATSSHLVQFEPRLLLHRALHGGHGNLHNWMARRKATRKSSPHQISTFCDLTQRPPPSHPNAAPPIPSAPSQWPSSSPLPPQTLSSYSLRTCLEEGPGDGELLLLDNLHHQVCEPAEGAVHNLWWFWRETRHGELQCGRLE
jgi:hypothetical protein